MTDFEKVDAQKTFKPLEKILFYIVLAIHFGFLVEFLIKGFILEKEDEDKSTLALTIFVILMSIFWIIFVLNFASRNIKQTKELYNKLLMDYNLSLKNAGYKSGSKKLAQAFSIIHRLQHEFNSVTDINIITKHTLGNWKFQFEWVCSYVAEALKEVNGQKNISVCIKFLYRNSSKKQSITTFVRDRDHSYRIYNDIETFHDLDENTALAEIVHKIQDDIPNGGFYLNNNLPQEPNFSSSSFKFYKQNSFDHNLTAEERDNNWKLPYKSTVISIIAPIEENHYDKNHLQGFLCLDSNEKNVWDSDMLETITGVAEGLSNVIKTFNDLTVGISHSPTRKQSRK